MAYTKLARRLHYTSMKRLSVIFILLALVPVAALTAPENELTNEIDLAETTLEVVGETEFAPVAEGAQILSVEELENEEFSAFEAPADKADPLDAVMQEALEEAASN